ncbi:MAG: hypothetical protein NXI07_05150 [bacterium]|nr:hypothetical protein [bacterium]
MIHQIQLRRGITMAETIVSTLLVGMVLVGTIQIVGPTVRSGTVMADKVVASNLARELSDEIATKYFKSTIDDDLDFIGTESGGSRKHYDDIDDYHGMSNTPPELSDESKLSNLVGWTRTVKVSHADLNSPGVDSGTYTGLKRVTVTVQKDGVKLAEVVTLHSHTADQLGLIVQEN